ncbi:peptide-N4-(N-acetyl-beta-glucosaminyl)asparagine amidase A-like [Achlya hypogyna]|uniref:Peptide-N4-(N-acetyl-beta-glucosaminyl)asparagine amidase A-like n=1 Tax=Achlya hypogyna TaxID=1202772 RepID=A0A1V9ZME6_ACHHY|nr:peptide-N4-(N-acetyl-beta-glucosaminyl)asparagine amidase A-like [Achlya hypogyna]
MLRQTQHAFDITLPVNTNQIEYDTPECTVSLMLNHSFGASYWRPFSSMVSEPPCINMSLPVVLLRWTALVPAGRQFDRIAAVWFDNFELLRTTTEEPRGRAGPFLLLSLSLKRSVDTTWEVLKDVSHYLEIFRGGGKVVVALDNIVDATYTSPFEVSVTLEFYKKKDPATFVWATPRPPDTVLSISNTDGLYGWFNVRPSTEGTNGAFVTLPRNAEQVYIEVFTSHHGCDEFWYTNPPNQFLDLLQTNCGNGAFREVQIFLDNVLAAVIWPFPLIYSGGISPYMWAPVVATGAFKIPTYLVDLTPFLGKLLDGKPHNISFGVGNGQDYWPSSGNLLVYLDKEDSQTTAVLEQESIPPPTRATVNATVNGPDMTFVTTAGRTSTVTTILKTSRGLTRYTVEQRAYFSNTQTYSNNGTMQEFNQSTTVVTTTTVTNFTTGDVSSRVVTEKYPLTGSTVYDEYQAVLVASTQHVQVPDVRRNFRPDAMALNGFQLTTTIDHAFLSTATSTGCLEALRPGITDATLEIYQHATSFLDSLVGGNGTDEAHLRASNRTGCFAMHVTGSYANGVSGFEEHAC